MMSFQTLGLSVTLLLLVNIYVTTAFDKEFCKKKSDGMHKDPEDCQYFYTCVSKNTYHTKCQTGLHFSVKNKQCDYKNVAGCDGDDKGEEVTTKKPRNRPTEGTGSKTTKKTGSKTTEATRPRPTTKRPSNPDSKNKCGRIVCYFPSWARYRNGKGAHKVKDIDATKCTHLIFAFATLTGNKLAPYESDDGGRYTEMMKHKKTNRDLKVLIAVGGWNLASAPFTAIVASAKNRKEFVDTTISFLRTNGFDGLDLDWEYPALRGSPKEDKNRFVLLCQELKAAFEKEAKKTGKSRLLLTAAVAAGADKIVQAYDVPPLNKALDFINIMAYDLHGSWEKTTGHNAPLFLHSGETGAEATLNVKAAIDTWVDLGADKKNLVIGLPMYGRTFKLSSSASSKLGAAASGPGKAGTYTQEAGMMSYYEICTILKKRGAKKHFIDDQKVPYVVDGDQWIGYDDPDSLKTKVQYILQNGYGGAMIWDTAQDDFTGTFCGAGKNPLLTAINDECRK